MSKQTPCTCSFLSQLLSQIILQIMRLILPEVQLLTWRISLTFLCPGDQIRQGTLAIIHCLRSCFMRDLKRRKPCSVRPYSGIWLWRCRNCHMSLIWHSMQSHAICRQLPDLGYSYHGYYTIPRHHLQEMYKLRNGTQILLVFSHLNITLRNTILSWHIVMPILWQCMKMLRLPVFPCYVTGMFSMFSGLSTPSSRQVAECGNLLASNTNLRSEQSSWRRTLPSEALKWFQPKSSGVKWKAAGILSKGITMPYRL